MLLPAVDKLVASAKAIQFAPPDKVFVSCLTGEVVGRDHVLTGEHWGRHLVSPVQFSRALASVDIESAVVVDLGPGSTLLSSLRRRMKDPSRNIYFSSLSAAGDTDAREMLNFVGRVWQVGAEVDCSHSHSPGSVGRVPLPGYPFERKRFWIDSRPRSAEANHREIPSVPSTSQLSPQVSPGSTERKRTPARTELERNIASIWEEVLGIKDVGVNDSFLDLGGDSLVALRVLARLDEMYGVAISPRTFLGEAATVAALAVAVVSALVASAPSQTARGVGTSL